MNIFKLSEEEIEKELDKIFKNTTPKELLQDLIECGLEVKRRDKMSKEDKKVWLINEQGQKFFIYETEKCDMEKELNETIQKLQQEKENYKKRIEELEEQNRIYRKQLNDAFDRGFIHRDKIKEIVEELKAEYIKELDKNSIQAFILKCKIEGLEELLKDGGE